MLAPPALRRLRSCAKFLYFVVKNTKNKKQMFIFYVPFTLYKLFDNVSGNNGVFWDSRYFCTAPAWPEAALVPPWPAVSALSPEVVHVYRIFLDSLPGYSGARPKSQCAQG